jgi:hypothetical protein
LIYKGLKNQELRTGGGNRQRDNVNGTTRAQKSKSPERKIEKIKFKE